MTMLFSELHELQLINQRNECERVEKILKRKEEEQRLLDENCEKELLDSLEK